MLEDLGNCVKIHDTVIPAVNIQVEGYPKWSEEHRVWYGIYLEILFEDGSLWEVTQQTEDASIMIGAYPNWGQATSGPVADAIVYLEGFYSVEHYTWVDVVRDYNVKLHCMELTKAIHWRNMKDKALV